MPTDRKPGAEMDAAYFETCEGWVHETDGYWQGPSMHQRLWLPPPVSTCDETAVRWVWPWLRERCRRVSIEFDSDGCHVDYSPNGQLPKPGHTSDELAAALVLAALSVADSFEAGRDQ